MPDGTPSRLSLDSSDSAKFAKGFTNHEQTDTSGLIYMQARFYAPWYGRFLSPDPARDQHFEQTQSWNIYSYVRNSPIMQIDPTGLDMEDLPGYKKAEQKQHDNANSKAQTKSTNDGAPKPTPGVIKPELAKAVPATPKESQPKDKKDWKEIADKALANKHNAKDAALELTKERVGDGSKAGNWADVPLKDAEHYMFYRQMVEDNVLNVGVAAVCIPLWDTRKIVTNPLGIDQTPASLTELKAGFLGVIDGLR